MTRDHEYTDRDAVDRFADEVAPLASADEPHSEAS